MIKFDYYIFIDYSENLIGYNIIIKDKIEDLLPKISRLKHYKDSKNKKLYIKNVSKTFKREGIKSHLIKFKIKDKRKNMEIYLDVLEFLKNHENCIIFISVDNNEYLNFRKMVNVLDGEKVKIVKESELDKNSVEYQLSLIIDNMLNIERLRKKNE